MSGNPNSSIDPPKLSKYLMKAMIGLTVAIPLCVLVDVKTIHPEQLSVKAEKNMDIVRWIGLPAALVGLVLGGHWLSASYQASERQKEWKQQAELLRKQETLSKTERGRREYVLEVIGLGVTVEKYRQGSLWNVLQKENWHTSIREQDPKKYPWSADDKGDMSGNRFYHAMENGLNLTPVYWGAPSFYAGGPIEDPEKRPSAIDPESGVVGAADTNGLPEHLFIAAQWKLEERPDQLLKDVFTFFDTHPDVPYVVVNTDDGIERRNMGRPRNTPSFQKNGYYIPDMPDAAAFFVLARRERIEPLRPFVFDDLDENVTKVDKLNASSFARRLYLMYLDLKESVPLPVSKNKDDQIKKRLPVVSEWLAAAAQFAQRPEIRGTDIVSHLNDFNPWTNRPARDWKPTPWFPIPWNRFQMETFDKLPSFGFIHRPAFIKFADDKGKPIKDRDQRQKILAAGWQQALLSLPETERDKGLARIIAAFGQKTEQEILLDKTLTDYAAQGGPTFDTTKIDRFINADRRLGNTGAATFLVQMAIGVMGSYRAGGTSAAINLRDAHEASIIFITPPSEEKRKEQESTHGDLFRHRAGPSIDPANYETPSIESISSTQHVGQADKQPHAAPATTASTR
jgi:hypothetical protein